MSVYLFAPVYHSPTPGYTSLGMLCFAVGCPLCIDSIETGLLTDTPCLSAPHAVVTDPEDPRFDLEKLIAKWEADSQ